MKYRVQNIWALTPDELLSILCKSAKLYSEYADTMYSKVAIMEQMLDLRHSKCYKIGEKNLVTRENDFEMATGNSN